MSKQMSEPRRNTLPIQPITVKTSRLSADCADSASCNTDRLDTMTAGRLR